MREETKAGSDPRIAPRLIVPMSLQLVIPRRVALQQSSPPLHQPSFILKEKRKFEKEKSMERHGCQFETVSTEGFTPVDCGLSMTAGSGEGSRT